MYFYLQNWRCKLRHLTYLIFLFTFVACNACCIKEDDASYYFYPCSKKATYTYNGFNNGSKIYERKLKYIDCNCKNDICSMAFDEETNYLDNSKYSKSKINYIISKNEVKKITLTNGISNKYEIILKAPIKIGNKWKLKTNEQSDIYCQITKTYNSQNLFDPDMCLIVVCDDISYDYCEQTGLEIVSSDGKFLEIIKKIEYEN